MNRVGEDTGFKIPVRLYLHISFNQSTNQSILLILFALSKLITIIIIDKDEAANPLFAPYRFYLFMAMM